eukprot:131569-Amphidinium_carterae.1
MERGACATGRHISFCKVALQHMVTYGSRSAWTHFTHFTHCTHARTHARTHAHAHAHTHTHINLNINTFNTDFNIKIDFIVDLIHDFNINLNTFSIDKFMRCVARLDEVWMGQWSSSRRGGSK